jgi:hypothetical protein
MYNQFRNASPPTVSANRLPDEYVAALKRTPMGLATLERVGKFDAARPLRVKITTDPLDNGDHGTSKTQRKYLDTLISTENSTPAGDRMNGWTVAEMINIVGIHESGHYVVTSEGAVTDQCLSFYCDCHKKVIYTELVARLQYSLIQSSVSAKTGWLDNYRRYFAKAAKMQADPDFAALCNAYAQKPVNSPEREQAAIDAQEYEGQNAPQPPFDSSIGETLALNAYNGALDDMEVSAARFLADGAYDDIGLYKKVVANMADYRNDKTFALIP